MFWLILSVSVRQTWANAALPSSLLLYHSASTESHFDQGNCREKHSLCPASFDNPAGRRGVTTVNAVLDEITKSSLKI